MLAQSVTVRFTARSTNGQYHPFESVRVENETQGWSQRIDYPDTIIVLGTSESIDVAEAIKGPQIKVYPNPFAGRTSTELQICEDGEATVSIMRINGSVVSEYNGFMKAGIYRLNVSLAEPQVAFLCVSTRSGRTVAKMVNTATGTADKIDISYLEGYSSQTKAVGIGLFNVGDRMSYNANYTSSNGITTSNTVTKSQTTSELITLFFTESSSTTLPTVTTSTVSNTTSSTATCGGNVTNDGNATVTARGVCWSTSHNPTVSNSHTTDGSGTGNFTSSMTGLSANTTYYVRAYATNSVGTAYGNEVSFTTLSVGGFDENGASNAVFTVASGHAVHFSRGNLQYQASTNTWRFAEHQYDIVGSANSNISSSYSGWIDLFGWGTSGWNSGAVCYQPWATSTSYSDYRPGGSYANNLTGAYANADWGVYNAISNGGNQVGMWRTLTKDEWSYLLNSRAASTVGGTANARYAKAKVNGTCGVIIFPNTFTLPTGMTVTNVNNSSGAYTSNTYTSSQWGQLEAAGCIFLPAAGRRNGTDVRNVGSYGFYWSSSYREADDPYASVGYVYDMYYYATGTIDVNGSSRNYGHSVRLVRR